MVQVGPIQMFGPKQNYLSEHLDRTSTGPGSEQLCRLNSLLGRLNGYSGTEKIREVFAMN